jgi:hypothetical protein
MAQLKEVAAGRRLSVGASEGSPARRCGGSSATLMTRLWHGWRSSGTGLEVLELVDGAA